MRLHAIQQFYSDRLGLMELDDDVQSIVRQVHQLYDGKVSVHLDEDTGEYYFVEHCEDHTDRLIFCTPELDGRALERLMKADSQGREHGDPYLDAEAEQDKLQADQDAAQLERVAEAGERLAWAMGDGEFGPGMKQSISVSKDLSDDSG